MTRFQVVRVSVFAVVKKMPLMSQRQKMASDKSAGD